MIEIANYAAPGDSSSFIPPFLQSISNAVGGRSVSPMRVILSALIFLLSLGGATVMLYGAIKSSVISIGRNPLSKQAIYHSLAQVLLMAVSLLAAAFAAIYFILRVV